MVRRLLSVPAEGRDNENGAAFVHPIGKSLIFVSVNTCGQSLVRSLGAAQMQGRGSLAPRDGSLCFADVFCDRV